METGRWNNHVFTVSPQVIRGFTGLTIKGNSETEDKKSGDQQYAARKTGKPAEVTLTVGLSALTGCRVREEALALVEDARAGAKNYFYVGGKKLMTCQMMLTEANVEQVMIAPDGAWVSAQVQMTLRQCGGNEGGAGGTSQKKKTKKKSLKSRRTGPKIGIAAGAATKAVAAARAAKAKTEQAQIEKNNKDIKAFNRKLNKTKTYRVGR